MAVKKKRQILKKKKKKWFSIVAPGNFGNLGEAYVADSNDIMGRMITLSLGAVTSIRNNNVNLTFRVVSVKEGKGNADLVGYKLVNAYLKRIVRKNKSKVEASYVLKSKDGKDVIIKPFLVTRSLITSKKARDLRFKLDEFVKAEVGANSSKELISSLVNNKLQDKMKVTLSKVYPLSVVAVKFFRIR